MKLSKSIKSLCILAPLTFLPLSAMACNNDSKSMIDTISYQVSSESSVETMKAEVYVLLNASISSSDLASIQNQAKSDLNGLIKDSNWSIEDYSQNKTASGLINVRMVLKDRLASNQLATLTDTLNSLDGKGKQYKIDRLNYQPSLSQMEQAKSKLRLQIIADVNNQLKALNKQTGQKYRVHSINFTAPYTAQPRANVMMKAYDSVSTNQQSGQSMQVATKLTLTADVELAKNTQTK